MMCRVQPDVTETVTLVALNGDVPVVVETIERTAHMLELSVDAIEQRPGQLSTEIRVTLTGLGSRIDDFRFETEGDGVGSGSPGGLVDQLLGDLIGAGLKRWRRRRRARARARTEGADPAAARSSE